MALANDSILIAPDGAGTTVATNLVGGKEHQVVQVADQDGHITGSASPYTMFMQPRVLTAAATDQFDFFNATGSGVIVRLRGIYAIIARTAATAFVVPWEFQVFRTSAIGTAGSSATRHTATAPTAGLATFAYPDSAQPALSANITARTVPTGGATAAHYWWSMYLMPEETFPAETMYSYINQIPEYPNLQPWEIRENEGFKIRQITATASTGAAFGWLLSFTTT